jgi:hypothetical protein
LRRDRAAFKVNRNPPPAYSRRRLVSDAPIMTHLAHPSSHARSHRSRAMRGPWSFVAAAVVATLAAPAAVAQSGGIEVYGKAGVPGFLLGIGLPVRPNLSLRADIGGIDKIERSYTESGITYDGRGKATRLGLFADWFPFGGGFRLTGGLTVNDMKLDLTAKGAGRVLEIGQNRYTLGADDQVDVRGEFPASTPYIGIGWGHHAADTGWGFRADLGASLGKPRVRATVTGPLAGQPGLQADIDREVRELEESVSSFRAFPQLTVGVSYRF